MTARNAHVAEPLRSIINAATPDVRRLPRHKANAGECPYCDREREAGNSFHPPHDASERCESGKHNHCSCDTCF